MKRFLRRVAWTPVLILPAVACATRSPSAPSENTTTSVPASFTVSGVVRDNLPSGGTGFTITGARIEVVAKPGVIATATTDGAGAYRVSGVAGRIQLRVIRPGYETTTVTVGPATTDQKADIALNPIQVRVTGIVTEAPPTQTRPVAGARVEVASGSNIGKAVLADANGRYTLTNVWGEFTLRITGNGFQELTNRLVLTGDDLSFDARLNPTAKVITDTFDLSRAPFRFEIPVHNDGQIAIVDFSGYGFEEGEGTTLQIWEDGRVVAQTFAERSVPRQTILLRAPATAGRMYEVRTVGGSPEKISISHPS